MRRMRRERERMRNLLLFLRCCPRSLQTRVEGVKAVNKGWEQKTREEVPLRRAKAFALEGEADVAPASFLLPSTTPSAPASTRAPA